MFGAFGMLALVLAAVGLYGVLAYDVSQRTHEMGVRVALGAQGRDVSRLVVWEGLRIVVVGGAIGFGIALAAGRFVAPLLFRTSPREPVVFGVVGLSVAARCAREPRIAPTTLIAPQRFRNSEPRRAQAML
jgi:ABC-type antimicrobial peptide transport system permease subunit